MEIEILRIHFITDRDVPLTAFSGVFVYTCALSMISRRYPSLSLSLHGKESKFKPLSCTCLFKENGQPLLRGTIKASQLYFFDIIGIGRHMSEVLRDTILNLFSKKNILEMKSCTIFIDLSLIHI